MVYDPLVEIDDTETEVISVPTDMLDTDIKEGEIPILMPLEFSKETLDGLSIALSKQPISKKFPGRSTPAQNASYWLAKGLAAEASAKNPSFFNYESLRDGTAQIFSYLPEDKNKPPKDRMLTDEQIIKLLAVDTEGNPIDEINARTAGLLKEGVSGLFSLAGAAAGAKAGAKIPVMHPAGKLVAVLASGLGGGFVGYKTGEILRPQILGKESPILPSQRANYAQGEAIGSILSWLPAPFLLSKNISFGADKVITNLMEARALAKLSDEALDYTAQKLPKKAPATVRSVKAIENFLIRTGNAARKNPIWMVVAPDIITAIGAGEGAKRAETYAPGETADRLFNEFFGGLVAAIIASPVSAIGQGTTSAIKNLPTILRTYRDKGVGGLLGHPIEKFRERGQRKAIGKIISIIEENGENTDEIIKQLTSTEFTQHLPKGKDGKSILTAGAKSGSPSLLAIEHSLSRLRGSLSGQQIQGAEAAINALENVMAAMHQSGDPKALAHLAEVTQKLFNNEIEQDLQRGVAGIQKVYEGLENTAKNKTRYSEELIQTLETMLKAARIKEDKLWKSVPNETLVVEQGTDPVFISRWQKLTSEQAPEVVEGWPSSIKKYINRVWTQESPDPITTQELQSMRSNALAYSRKLSAEGNLVGSRAMSRMSDAFKKDIENHFEVHNNPEAKLAYHTARAMGRSIHEVFSKTFAGTMGAAKKTGAPVIEPELLLQKLKSGGIDATSLRFQQIRDVGQFFIDQKIADDILDLEDFPNIDTLEDLENLNVTLDLVTESVLRAMRAEDLFDAQGKLIAKKLANWLDTPVNKNLLESFPALKNDLSDLRRAQQLVDLTNLRVAIREKDLKNQASFYNLVPDKTESIHGAISQAIDSKTPIKHLNGYLKMIKDEGLKAGNEEIVQEALEGFKSSIIERGKTAAGGSGNVFSPKAFYEELFTPLKATDRRTALVDWMVDNELMLQPEADALEKITREMVKYEAVVAAGKAKDIKELVDTAGPLLDFYISVAGSVLGTRTQRLLTPGEGVGPGALVAASKGSETLRRLFNDIPGSKRLDVMNEMMEDPQLLALMLREGVTEQERKARLAQAIGDYLIRKGLRTPAKMTPSVIRETEREEPPRIIPPRQVAPVPKPKPVGPLSGKVSTDAALNYAALNPNDLISPLLSRLG